MCKAFSCIVTDRGEALWKLAVDSHSGILHTFAVPDKTANVKELEFAKIEITPTNGNYIKPDKWVFYIDEAITPDWWEPGCEKAAWAAHKEWYRQIRKMLVFKKIVHPFQRKHPKTITKKHLALLRQWDSVRDSVRGSVWDSVEGSVRDSVRDSVGDSVGDSVRDSVGDSVGDSVWGAVRGSVWDSVWAYTGSHFKLSRKAWKYTEKISGNDYPFQPVVDLWEAGLVTSYDGKKWRLHGGKNAAILWEGTIE